MTTEQNDNTADNLDTITQVKSNHLFMICNDRMRTIIDLRKIIFIQYDNRSQELEIHYGNDCKSVMTNATEEAFTQFFNAFHLSSRTP